MLALMDQVREPLVATDEEAVIAQEAVEKLSAVALASLDVRVRVAEKKGADIVVPLPARAVKMIVAVLTAMAERKPISLIPHTAELTTQQASDFLNVSRPYLVGLLEKVFWCRILRSSKRSQMRRGGRRSLPWWRRRRR
jgi:hypothetical protein